MNKPAFLRDMRQLLPPAAAERLDEESINAAFGRVFPEFVRRLPGEGWQKSAEMVERFGITAASELSAIFDERATDKGWSSEQRKLSTVGIPTFSSVEPWSRYSAATNGAFPVCFVAGGASRFAPDRCRKGR